MCLSLLGLPEMDTNLPGSFVAAVEGGAGVAMSDGGSGPDATSSDGVYSALVRLPASGMTARVKVDASCTAGGITIQRAGSSLTEIVEPRASINGKPNLSKALSSSGKVQRVYVDVPVGASQGCTVRVAADILAAGVLVTQSSSLQGLSAGSSTNVRIALDAEDLKGLPANATQVLASVRLLDSTDGGLSMLGATTSDQFALSRASLALASCTIDPFFKPVSGAPVIITGASSCSSETIAGVDISLNGGADWSAVPAPDNGWGSNSATWACAFALPKGEYGAMVRLRGRNGLIAGATDSMAFTVVPAAYKTVYRFRNITNGFYLWSADESEKASIVANLSRHLGA